MSHNTPSLQGLHGHACILLCHLNEPTAEHQLSLQEPSLVHNALLTMIQINAVYSTSLLDPTIALS